MANHLTGVKHSQYRQVRFTVTQELNGTLSYRAYAKGLDQGWQERHCIAAGRVEYSEPILSIEDALRAVMATVREQFLPGIG
uniref:Uncharacterized protein n=1 Tax=uncultured prokaryote TaxID=198431 RepID=A0A0H5Q5B0_9ZZZZ|nr:hypothetical protein [uncultured prokaryote]